jgi:hypothetical protein
VQAVDEYTFFADGTPKVSGATVTLTDPNTGTVVKTGTTDANGELLLTGVTEGYYQLEARADGHNASRSNILVTASQVTEVSAFLSRELISYVWTVTPTEIQDHYTFTLDVKFATDVPAPVVTIEPASIDLSTLTDDTTQINFTVTNHGLIAAEHVNLSFEDDPVWKITPLAGNVGTLAAKQSVVIPVTFRHLRASAQKSTISSRELLFADNSPGPAPGPQGKCQIDGSVDSDFQCGGTAQKRSTPVKAYNGDGDCGPLPTGYMTAPPKPSDVTEPSTSVSQNKDCSAEILRDGDKISDKNAKALPGQKINLTLKAPGGAVVKRWVVADKTFKNYDPNAQNGQLQKLKDDDLNGQEVNFYWASSGSKTVSVEYDQNGEARTATASIEVLRPTVFCFTSAGAPRVNGDNANWELALRGAFIPNLGPLDPGVEALIHIDVPEPFPAGQFEFIQLLRPFRMATHISNAKSPSPLNYHYGLDNRSPYSGPYGTDEPTTLFATYQDSPAFTDLSYLGNDPVESVVISDYYETYLLFHPPGTDSRWVPLMVWKWNWAASASVDVNGNSTSPPAHVDSGASPSGTFIFTDEFPEWSETLTNTKSSR